MYLRISALPLNLPLFSFIYLIFFLQTTEMIHHYRFRETKEKAVKCASEILPSLLSLFQRDDSHPIIVSGRSGSGKTTLMANAISSIRAQFLSAVIVYRYNPPKFLPPPSPLPPSTLPPLPLSIFFLIFLQIYRHQY